MHLTVKAVLKDSQNAKRSTKFDINIIYKNLVNIFKSLLLVGWNDCTDCNAREVQWVLTVVNMQTAMLTRELLLAKQHLKAKVSHDE